MFEDSLFASGVSAGTKTRPVWARWTVLTSVGLQGLVVTAIVLVPMLRPDTLPPLRTVPLMANLMLRKPPEVRPDPVKPRPVVDAKQQSIQAPSRAAATIIESRASGMIQRVPASNAPDGPPTISPGIGMGDRFSLGIGAGTAASGSAPVVVAGRSTVKDSKPPTVSGGVAAGRLLAPIKPVYPHIAVATRTEGTVIVTAVIDKSGRIANLQVLSGPEMLRTAAVDAVKEARYKPFLLSGEPTEVATTISVTFRMGG